MTTLTISDLSVGDLVYYNEGNKPYAIRCIYCTDIRVCVILSGDESLVDVIAFVDELTPIPITAEILEKTGFEKAPALSPAYHADKVWISYDKLSETWDVTIHINNVMPTLYAKILHIHQLQHVLRLAGVDIEINL